MGFGAGKETWTDSAEEQEKAQDEAPATKKHVPKEGEPQGGGLISQEAMDKLSGLSGQTAGGEPGTFGTSGSEGATIPVPEGEPTPLELAGSSGYAAGGMDPGGVGGGVHAEHGWEIDKMTSPFEGGHAKGVEAGGEGSGIATHSSVDLPVDPRYGQSMEALRQIIGGSEYDNMLRQGQYEALTKVGPGEGIAGAVGQVGSRAGGQIAQQRQMSDIQMVQALAGAKVEAQKAREQAVIAASGEIRNIMQQQLDAFVSTQKLGLEAQEALQNRATAAFNMIQSYMTAAVNSNVLNDEDDFEQFGFAVQQWWDWWQSLPPDEQTAAGSKWPDFFTEAEHDAMPGVKDKDDWDP